MVGFATKNKKKDATNMWYPSKSSHSPPTCTAARKAAEAEGLPDSIKRVGTTEAFPNEYPGQIYAFNWCLNGDGVTPLRKSSFRITKPLDLKVAELKLPKKNPLKVILISRLLSKV